MHVGKGVPHALDLNAGGEDTLIVRPAAEVDVCALPPGAAGTS